METWAEVAIPKGFKAAGVTCGIKQSGKPDMAMIVSDHACTAAGTFTLNRVAAAPVQWDRALVPNHNLRGVVVNSGNANAATGQQGLDNAAKMAELAAQAVGCHAENILVASTGVIGHQMPMDKIAAGIAAARSALTDTGEGFRDASQAIMTTDTHPKVAGTTIRTQDGEVVHILGMCKGAAMIGPRMATMLAFLFTDAKVPENILRSC